MSTAYLAETAEFLASNGWELKTEEETRRRDGAPVFDAIRHTLAHGSEAEIVLEGLRYPDDREVFYLEIRRYHQISSYSYPLDSWRHRPGQVEFKFRPHPDDGLGFAFTLRVPS